MMTAKFGPAGNCDAFYASGRKATVEAPAWLKEIGLDAYEFQAGNGLRVSDATLTAIGNQAKHHGIAMSLHTPYFISLSGVDPEKRLKSITYIKDSLHAASLLGADIIVIHTGSAAKISREEAMSLAADTLYKTLEEIGDQPIKLGLETMGKINQLGTLEEVIALCKIDPILCPVVDWGHMNSRNVGGLFPDADAYRRVFHSIGEVLGDSYAKNLHCHFSKIEYTSAGEKKHLTFEDEVYGPSFEPLAEVIAKDGLSPRIICESAGTQEDDALFMKHTLENLIK